MHEFKGVLEWYKRFCATPDAAHHLFGEPERIGRNTNKIIVFYCYINTPKFGPDHRGGGGVRNGLYAPHKMVARYPDSFFINGSGQGRKFVVGDRFNNSPGPP